MVLISSLQFELEYWNHKNEIWVWSEALVYVRLGGGKYYKFGICECCEERFMGLQTSELSRFGGNGHIIFLSFSYIFIQKKICISEKKINPDKVHLKKILKLFKFYLLDNFAKFIVYPSILFSNSDIILIIFKRRTYNFQPLLVFCNFEKSHHKESRTG